MKATKWINPTTGEVRVYIKGFKGDSNDVKAFVIADINGWAVLTISGAEGRTSKNIDIMRSDIRGHFGLYAKFQVYLDECHEIKATETHAYGSDYANAFERATGESFGE